MPKKDTNTSLNKSKLIKLLAKLPPKTVKTFKAWYKQMGSPKRDAFLILDYLLLYYPDFDSTRLLQDIAFKKIFGQLPYDYRKLMKGVSQVHVDLKQYLVHQELAEDESLNNFLLAKIYTKYELFHERQLLINKQLSPKSSPNHPDDFHHILQWEDLSFFSEIETTKNANKQGITNAMAALDWYYLGQKLKYACEISTQKKLYNLTYSINLESAIITFCQINFEQLPLFHQVYFTAWRLIQLPSSKHFEQLKEIYISNYHQFNAKDQLYVLTHLINFTSNQLRKKTANALEDAFDLYRFGIEHQILVIDTLFIDVHFVNIISICSALEKFEWIESKLTSELYTLVKNQAPSTYNIALARLSFAKKDFMACISYLIGVDYKIFGHSSKARSYQIACAYELNESPHIIESHCKSFENYLRRNSHSFPLKVAANLNFIHMMRQLNKPNPNKSKIQSIFDKAHAVSFHAWLQQKIIDLS